MPKFMTGDVPFKRVGAELIPPNTVVDVPLHEVSTIGGWRVVNEDGSLGDFITADHKPAIRDAMKKHKAKLAENARFKPTPKVEGGTTDTVVDEEKDAMLKHIAALEAKVRELDARPAVAATSATFTPPPPPAPSEKTTEVVAPKGHQPKK